MDFIVLFAALLIVAGAAYFLRRKWKRQRTHAKFEVSWTLGDKILVEDTATGTDQLLTEDVFMMQTRELAEKNGWTTVHTGPQREKISKRGRKITVTVTNAKGKDKTLAYKAIQV